MRTKSALSDARRADVTGLGVRTGTKFPNEQVRSMIGIVLVTHGRLAAEFRAALEHVAGPQKQIESIAIGPDDDIEQRRQDIVSAVTKVDSGAGVVVLADMFGGTPSNLAISIMNGSNIEVVVAVNLPMLIKLASVRETSSLEQAVIQAQDAGRRYICAASRVLGAEPDRVDMPFERINAFVGWEAFRPALDAALNRPAREKGGRPPFDAVLMFKVLVLHALYNLPDEQTEYQILDRLSFMKFLGLELHDGVPDARTIWLFRETLIKAGAVEQLFGQFDAMLDAHGFQASGGQIIDATFVEAPRQRNSRGDNETIKKGEVPAGWSGKKKAHKVRRSP